MDVGVEMGVSLSLSPPHWAHSPWTTAKVPDGSKGGTAETVKKSRGLRNGHPELQRGKGQEKSRCDER